MRTSLLCMLVLMGAVGVASAGVIKNGGFESQDPERDRPASWHHNARNAGDWVELGWDHTAAHSGESSIFIHIREDYPDDKKSISWMWTSKAGGLAVGHRYRLRAWVKTKDVGFTPTILVQFRNSEDAFLGRADTHTRFPLTGTNDWTEVSTEFEVPPQTTHVKIRAAVRAMENSGGTVWFDDITVERVVE